MNCKIKWMLAFLIFCATALFVGQFVPPKTAGYIVMLVFGLIGGTILFVGMLNALAHVRNPYQGAANLRNQARKVAAHDGIPVSTAAQNIFEDAQAKGETTPKRELDSMPRPVTVDGAHIQHIRSNEPMPLAGYDQTPAKDPERFGVIQQPELPAGNDVDGIWVDVTEKQHSPIREA